MAKKESRHFDFKDVEGLQVYMTSQGLLLPAKRSGLNAREQRRLKRAIKQARFLALLPYTA
ncbi:MAG: 30S ribosomal protein S18 [Planctomycetota bacterium]|nr:30S ribosomal protein S18 [Planctomycetota bacterium]